MEAEFSQIQSQLLYIELVNKASTLKIIHCQKFSLDAQDIKILIFTMNSFHTKISHCAFSQATVVAMATLLQYLQILELPYV